MPFILDYEWPVEVIANPFDLAENYIHSIEDQQIPYEDISRHQVKKTAPIKRNSADLISGYVIRIPGEDGLFFTSYMPEYERQALRWDYQSSRYLAFNSEVEIICDVYDLAKFCLRDLESQAFISRPHEAYDIYSGSPAIISVDGYSGFFYTHINRLPQGLYDVRAKRWNGSEEISLTQEIKCDLYLDMKNIAAQYIERAEELERRRPIFRSQVPLSQFTLFLRSELWRCDPYPRRIRTLVRQAILLRPVCSTGIGTNDICPERRPRGGNHGGNCRNLQVLRRNTWRR